MILIGINTRAKQRRMKMDRFLLVLTPAQIAEISIGIAAALVLAGIATWAN